MLNVLQEVEKGLRHLGEKEEMGLLPYLWEKFCSTDPENPDK